MRHLLLSPLTKKPRLHEIQELLQASTAAPGRARLRLRSVSLQSTTSQPRATLLHHTPQTLTKAEVDFAASWAPTATYPSPPPPPKMCGHAHAQASLLSQTPCCSREISQSLHTVIKPLGCALGKQRQTNQITSVPALKSLVTCERNTSVRQTLKYSCQMQVAFPEI